jgi:hypothetical protein
MSGAAIFQTGRTLILFFVMAGLRPAIHVFLSAAKSKEPGTSARTRAEPVSEKRFARSRLAL